MQTNFRKQALAFSFLLASGLVLTSVAAQADDTSSSSSSASTSSVSAASGSAESTPTATAPTANISANISNSLDVAPPHIGPFTVKAAITSQNTTGRRYDYDASNGRRFRLKNEYSAGLVHTSGWGLSAMGVTNGVQYGAGDDKHIDGYTAGDPSLTLAHPVLYKDRDLTLSGQFRKYFAVTNRSKDRNQNQYAYYLFSNYVLPRGMAVFNQLTPRYFQQSYYQAADTNWFVEDYTALTKTVNSWFKYGVGQHAQMEWHDKTSAGQSVEIYPLADFVVSSNIYIEPRVYFPVLSVNTVYDAPRAVDLADTQAEVFIRMAM